MVPAETLDRFHVSDLFAEWRTHSDRLVEYNPFPCSVLKR